MKPAYLSQHLEELDPTWRVLEAVEKVAQRVELSKGRELSATQLCERLGFGGDAQWTPVGDLSGGERRRLQLTRLLMGGPNVLVLDEPTNDFDVETLTALEDLLDSFGGTLLVISHDRYFLERVCDRVRRAAGRWRGARPARGLEQYLELIHDEGRDSRRLLLVPHGLSHRPRPLAWTSALSARSSFGWSGSSPGSTRKRLSCTLRCRRTRPTTSA